MDWESSIETARAVKASGDRAERGTRGGSESGDYYDESVPVSGMVERSGGECCIGQPGRDAA